MVAIPPQGSSEIRRYEIVGGTLDAVDRLKEIGSENSNRASFMKLVCVDTSFTGISKRKAFLRSRRAVAWHYQLNPR